MGTSRNITGWCIDNLHNKCVEFYVGRYEHTCHCPCHNKKED